MAKKQNTAPTSQFKKSHDVKLGTVVLNNTSVTTYTSTIRDLKLIAKEWPRRSIYHDRYYFEIQILSIGSGRKISLGVIDEKKCKFVAETSFISHPTKNTGEFEYHADGRIICAGKPIPYDTEVRFDEKNAIIGCGVDFNSEHVFFVLPDGSKRYIPSEFRLDPIVSLTPFVKLNKQGEQITVNFGEQKFKHDPFGNVTKTPLFFESVPYITQKIERNSAVKVTCGDCTTHRSLRANQGFDRSTGCPYFEIKIIKSESHVMLGFCEKTKYKSFEAIGSMSHSVGWSGPSSLFDHLTGHCGNLTQSKGDIFGCGITMDSYNTNRAFITKNGKWIGFVSSSRKVHDGHTECFPTISVLAKAILSYNFGAAKFAFDTNQLPKYRRTAGINALPQEILEIIFENAGHSAAFSLLSIAPVNKWWNNIVEKHDRMWRRLYYEKFPNQNPELKVKLWSRFFKQRAKAMKTVSDPHHIENCSLAFECPLILENFKNVTKDAKNVFCDTCQKDVYIVDSIQQLKQFASLGRCVAWKVVSQSEDFMGGLYYDE